MTITIDRKRAYLERCVRNARADVDTAQASLRAAELNKDEFELRNRPTYPTTEMRLALERAVQDVKDGYKPTSHLGRTLSDGVKVHGKQGFISVTPEAPWGQAHNGKLWTFTSDEIALIREHIEALGLKIIEWWTHEGVSFTVEVARRVV